jgi:hypothetical protein
VLALTAAPGAGQADAPCQTDARRRSLDFLIGTWDAVGASGEIEGSVRVEATLGGCLLIETSRALPGGSEAVGYWHYDPAAGVWRVTRVDQEGQSFRLEGKGSGDEISVSGEMSSADGAAGLVRGTRRRLADGRIQQQWESSENDGKTWTELWRGHYVRSGTAVTRTAAPAPPEPERATVRPAPPARAATPATPPAATAPPLAEPPPTATSPRAAATPAPATATASTPTRPAAPSAASTPPAAAPAPPPRVARSGDVEARSLEPSPPPAPASAAPPEGDVAELSPRDRGPRRDPIRMTSPMQLQFPIGPVEKLPEGYGWTSTDTGAYQVDNVRLDSVEVSRRPRRGQVDLAITLRASAATILANASATVELLDGSGAAVESADLGRFPLGKSLTEQSQYGFVAKAVTFSFEPARFDELFAGAARPQLRITLTTGESR